MQAPATDWRFECHDSLPSTQSSCIARAEQGEPAGLAILARAQPHGTGRHGRGWSMLPGNLALSVLLRPQAAAASIPQWSLLAGLAVIQALDAHAPPAGLQLKWPNDILLRGAKLAGLLLNAAMRPDQRCDWLVIGVGANLAAAPPLQDRPTARLPTEPPPTPDQVARAVLARIAYWQHRIAVDGFAPLRAAWLDRAHPIGSPIAAAGVPGTFAGLDQDGALLLRTASGVQRQGAGEITWPLATAAPAIGRGRVA